VPPRRVYERGRGGFERREGEHEDPLRGAGLIATPPGEPTVEQELDDQPAERVADQDRLLLERRIRSSTIGVIWFQHSSITATLRRADSTLYRLNLLVLLLASFLPFPTEARRGVLRRP
jgi:hypothetical protein